MRSLTHARTSPVKRREVCAFAQETGRVRGTDDAVVVAVRILLRKGHRDKHEGLASRFGADLAQRGERLIDATRKLHFGWQSHRHDTVWQHRPHQLVEMRRQTSIDLYDRHEC